jgi:hypothetical protein
MARKRGIVMLHIPQLVYHPIDTEALGIYKGQVRPFYNWNSYLCITYQAYLLHVRGKPIFYIPDQED